MNRRNFLKSAGMFAFGAMVSGCNEAAMGKAGSRPLGVARGRPNLVMIYADDLGYGDLACFGHPTIKTPNLDRMAQEGAKLSQFYSAASVCTPSRAALMTGRLPIRNGMCSDKRAVLFPDSAGGIPAGEVTIAEILKEQGYATGCVGKWHLGHLPQYLPTSNGFDSYFGIPYSNDMSRKKGVKGNDGSWQNFDVPIMRDEKEIERPANQTTLTKRYGQEAVKFIKTNKDKPFFLYLAHNLPHIPLFRSKEFADTSLRGLYGDVVQEIDYTIGQVLKTIKDLGIAENTLVIFSSDNGPWLVFNEDGGSAGLLRDGKGSTWEGGMREPTIAWWPGTIQAGRMITDMTSTLDVLPTFAELAGGALPGDRIYDGYSMVDLLKGRASGKRNIMYYYRGQQLRALRKGAWKIHLFTKTEYKGQKVVKHDPPLLYNVEVDPSEKYEIGKNHPDIIKDLLAEVEKHTKTVKPYPSQLEERIKT